jgi:hypothetical protein
MAAANDLAVRRALEAVGVAFIDGIGGPGPGVLMRKGCGGQLVPVGNVCSGDFDSSTEAALFALFLRYELALELMKGTAPVKAPRYLVEQLPSLYPEKFPENPNSLRLAGGTRRPRQHRGFRRSGCVFYRRLEPYRHQGTHVSDGLLAEARQLTACGGSRQSDRGPTCCDEDSGRRLSGDLRYPLSCGEQPSAERQPADHAAFHATLLLLDLYCCRAMARSLASIRLSRISENTRNCSFDMGANSTSLISR